MYCSAGRSWFARKHGTVLLYMVLSFILLFQVSTRTVSAQSGHAILLRSLQTYHDLNSYEGKANVDIMFQDRYGAAIKHVASATVMKFEKPNKLYLYFSTSVGTRAVYCDGKFLYVYDGLPKQYTVDSAGKSLAEIASKLSDHVVVPLLDPYYFLSQSGLPQDLHDISSNGTSMFNGQQVDVVTGFLSDRKAKGVQTKWTWYIDSGSKMILRVESRTDNVSETVILPRAEGKNDVRPMVGTLIVRQTISNIRPNTIFSADVFTFKRPPDSHERKSTAALLAAPRN